MEFYYHHLDHGEGGDVLVLAADGGLDADTSGEFSAAIEKLADAGIRKIIIDCSTLTYISSRGVATLIMAHKRLRSRGSDVKIAGAKGLVMDVLRMARLDTFFELYPDVDRARLAFRPVADGSGDPAPAGA